MSMEYDIYLVIHKESVRKGLAWFIENLPQYVSGINIADMSYGGKYEHDASKTTFEEYDAYDKYFYGRGTARSYETVQNFNYAWLHHIHNNPHHWQYWILQNDDPELGEVFMDIPARYLIEMICDWWSFSWKTGDLYSMFDWYEERKDYIKMNDSSRKVLERILKDMRKKLDENLNKTEEV